VISGLISSYLIWEARQLGAPRWLIARMMANTFLDTTVGAIPVVGDAFDVMFRANMKNMALLRRHMEKRGLKAALVRSSRARPFRFARPRSKFLWARPSRGSECCNAPLS
jgi:hypothetical protein